MLTMHPEVRKSPASPEGPDGNAAPSTHRATILLDDPAEWSSFGRPFSSRSKGVAALDLPPEATAWDSQVILQGMHCAACALTVEDALRTTPGVLRVEVSVAAQRARVVWDPQQIRPSGWMASIEQAGYGALPAMDRHAREQRQKESRQALWRWLVAGFCMMQVMMYAWPAYVAQPGDLSLEMERLLRWASWVLSLPVVFFSCGPFFVNAWRDVVQRRVSMDLPVALGMLITFVVSTAGTFDPSGLFGREVFFDSLTMFVFFLLTGRWLELRLRDRTAGALEAVMNRLPDSVERKTIEGVFERVAIRRLVVGDVVRVLPGEAFPADGRILVGLTHADESLLTGESTPVLRGVGAVVIAGSYNLLAPVEVQVEGVGAHTRFAEIVGLMESASTQKPRLAHLADRIARPFLLIVLLAAALAAVWWWPSDPAHAVMVAVAVLIVTCPCALSLATPVAMLTAAGTLARHGVLVRNLQGLEALAAVDTFVFDKTGTVTADRMVVRSVALAAGVPRKEALSMAAALARQSRHPVSRAVLEAVLAEQDGGDSRWQVRNLTEEVGRGVYGEVRDALLADLQPWQRLCLGSLATGVTGFGVRPDQGPEVFLSRLALDGGETVMARFGLAEFVRPDAAAAVQALQAEGVSVCLLSGDQQAAVQAVAEQVGIRKVLANCRPHDKFHALREWQSQGHKVAMVGDGLNDGPVLAGAHVSFAFGRSVPLAQSQSDFVVVGDRLERVIQTVALARRTLKIIRQNLAWAAAYNAISVPLAWVGWMPAWLAGLGMALSSLWVVLNSARLARALPEVASEVSAASVGKTGGESVMVMEGM